MRVCVVTSARLGEGAWGVENFIAFLNSWLQERGYDVALVYRSLLGAKGGKGYKNSDGRVLYVPYEIFTMEMLLFSLLAVMRIVALNKDRRISLIHAQDTGYGGLAAVIAAKMLGVPLVISSHGLKYVTLLNSLKGPLKPLELAFERAIDWFVCRRADAVIGVSKYVENYLKEHYGLLKCGVPTFAIPVGVDIKKYRYSEMTREMLRQELHFRNDEVVIGFVGRFWPEKNLLFLLEAFADLEKLAPKARLLLVGEGPLKQKMEKFLVEKGLNSRVVFTGMREDVNRLLAAIDIFVLPSFTEGSPTALFEALAARKAIVASDIPGIREIVHHGKDALLINPRRVAELKQTLLLLCNTPELRENLGRAAEEKAVSHDLSEVGAEVLNVYEQLLKQHSKRYGLKPAPATRAVPSIRVELDIGLL